MPYRVKRPLKIEGEKRYPGEIIEADWKRVGDWVSAGYLVEVAGGEEPAQEPTPDEPAADEPTNTLQATAEADADTATTTRTTRRRRTT